MRKELEPKMEIAEKLYPQIKHLIEKYAEYCDENGDEELVEYKNLENSLHEITGKDMTKYNLSEWWEGEGLEVLSFRIALPEPNIIADITKDELLEIVEILKMPFDESDFAQNDTENDFSQMFKIYLDDYYRVLLKINFKGYKHEYFNRQKGKDGKYFEYSAGEIVEKIWGKK
ncbi:MAG: hypothetical protein FWG66_14705 [Spirochaetes bacterium]|nr:hypothetical protein [Spirochaetota bacterium]